MAQTQPAVRDWGEAWQQAARRWRPFGRRVAKATGWMVWNPGEYGERWHRPFRELYPPVSRPVMFFGLNPGPYGMAQSGLAFTDIKRLREHLPKLVRHLESNGHTVEIPGLAPASLRPYLTRTFESSSVRVYRFLQQTYGTVEKAARRVVVANPCPLLFLDGETGRNVTPADLGRAVRQRGLDDAKEMIAEMNRLREETSLEAIHVLRPRAAVLLGKDAQAAIGPALSGELGEQRVVPWEHPARAVPQKWADGLEATLRKHSLLPR